MVSLAPCSAPIHIQYCSLETLVVKHSIQSKKYLSSAYRVPTPGFALGWGGKTEEEIVSALIEPSGSTGGVKQSTQVHCSKCCDG